MACNYKPIKEKPEVYEFNTTGRTEYITPRWVIDALGPFDLDPCAATIMPYPTAKTMLTIEDDGLTTPWPKRAFVFLNPPYGGGHTGLEVQFVKKLAGHPGGGIALIMAKLSTHLWQRHVFPAASAYLAIDGRIMYNNNDGVCTEGTYSTPQAIVAFGDKAVKRLQRCKLLGWLHMGPFQPIAGPTSRRRMD